MSRRSLVVVCFAAGCSEYEFLGDVDPGEVTDCGTLDVAPVDVDRDQTCLVEPQVGTFTPVIKARNTSIGDAYTTPVVGQLTDDNGDGLVNGSDMPDIVVAGVSGMLYVLSNDLQTIAWSASAMGYEPATPAIGDVNGDGRPDVVAAGSSGVAAYDGRTGATLWSLASIPGASKLPICGGVGLYDLDLNGTTEVVIGRTILNGADGSFRGAGTAGEGAGHPWAASFGAAADLNGDGRLEVVTGNAAYRDDGSLLWSNGGVDGFVAVADFDGDEGGEVAVTTFASPSTVRLLDDNGGVLWETQLLTPVGSSSTIGPPTVADFDGDGEPEIGVAGNNVYAVFETNGTIKWSKPVTDWSSGFTGSSVFDFEGDGAAEVVYADENDVWVFDGKTGAVKMQETSHSSATCSEYPSIADVDKDGHAEIIYTSSAYSGSESGVTIIGDAGNSWMSGRPVWNQHTYAITNVNPDSSMPADAAPNWPTFNNWRSGDVTPLSGNQSADALPIAGDVCAECAGEFVNVVVHVGNGGMDVLPGGTLVSVYALQAGVPVLVETQATDAALLPGDSTFGLRFDVPVSALVDDAVRVVVDDDGAGVGAVAECHEDNNVLELTGLCGG